MSAPKKAKKIIDKTMVMTSHMSVAWAHVFLLGWVPSPKAHTKYITMLTNGIKVMRMVTIQSWSVKGLYTDDGSSSMAERLGLGRQVSDYGQIFKVRLKNIAIQTPWHKKSRPKPGLF